MKSLLYPTGCSEREGTNLVWYPAITFREMHLEIISKIISPQFVKVNRAIKRWSVLELFVWVWTAECPRGPGSGSRDQATRSSKVTPDKSAGNKDSAGSWPSDPDLKEDLSTARVNREQGTGPHCVDKKKKSNLFIFLQSGKTFWKEIKTWKFLFKYTHNVGIGLANQTQEHKLEIKSIWIKKGFF